MLELRCPTHPTYGAKLKPRVECADCIDLYHAVQAGDPITEADFEDEITKLVATQAAIEARVRVPFARGGRWHW